MGASIAAIFYSSISILFAYLFKTKSDFGNIVKRAFIVWISVIPLIFLIENTFFLFFLVFILLILVMPREPSDRVAFFILTLSAIPAILRVKLPFPGLNYLLYLSYWKILVLITLTPLLLQRRDRHRADIKWNLTDFLIVVYVIYISAIALRSLPLTSSARILFDQTLLAIIPYFVIRRSLKNINDISKCITSLLVLAIILGSIGLVSEFKAWNFYVGGNPGVRFGLIRISTTMNAALSGLLIGIGIIALQYFLTRDLASRLKIWGLRLIFLFALYFTISRGAWLACAASWGCYFFMTSRRPFVRSGLVGLTLIGFLYVFVQVSSSGYEEFDAFGTFEYRDRLFRASFLQISDKPLFGDPNFLKSENFSPLFNRRNPRIDIVNTYLQVVLKYGLLGLFFFCAMFFSCIWGLYKRYRVTRKSRFEEDDKRLKAYSFIFSILFAYLLFIATISDVSIIMNYGFLFLALGRALVGLEQRSADEQSAIEQTQDRIQDN